MKESQSASRPSTRKGKRHLVVLTYRVLRRGERYIPPILRGILGLLLMAGGVLGFLPILGFWMIPLGLALLATDIPWMRRWFIKHLRIHRHRPPRQ